MIIESVVSVLNADRHPDLDTQKRNGRRSQAVLNADIVEPLKRFMQTIIGILEIYWLLGLVIWTRLLKEGSVLFDLR